MARKLELIREEKLYRLLPGRKKSSRLEASGVALTDKSTALVVFDNLNWVARIDLSLEESHRNTLLPAPSLGSGFEDIAIDQKQQKVFCMVESVEDFDGHLRGFVSEFDFDGKFLQSTRLHTLFEKANKGFEGLAHLWHGPEEWLYALCEGNLGTSAKRGGGRIDVFVRDRNGNWEGLHQIGLPKQAEFEDYSALAYENGQIAVASQASARLWVAQIDDVKKKIVPGSGKCYRFPSKSYGNIEGIAWLSEDTIVAVSDRAKSNQPDRCTKKEQSIHIFRIPH
ncbi:MAG TPA: hypothetical protein VK589_29535 [Chryseolinea sp.]|nr:hypothetical protein [Chryseolinea sp.]